ncbi:MAG: hypothetical protein WD054_01100 [Gemmatimonadota bacterium]
MNTAILLIGLAGFAAVALRLAGTMLLVLRRSADVFVAGGLAGTRAERGDLTGVDEATNARMLARRRRLTAIGHAFLWGGLLVVPFLTPWPGLLYAAYSLLWLLPRRDVRVTRARQ